MSEFIFENIGFPLSGFAKWLEYWTTTSENHIIKQ